MKVSLKERLSCMDKLIGKSLKVNVHMLANGKYTDLVKEIVDETSFLPEDASLTNRVYCVMNDIKDNPKCGCGNNVNFFRYSTGYFEFCGKKCTYKGSLFGQRTKEKYANISQDELDIIVEKRKKTNIEKYGVDNYFKLPEFIEGNYEPELVAKRDANRIISMQEKHGVDNVFQLESIKEKCKQTSIEKYGVESPTQKHIPKETLDILNDKTKLAFLLSLHPYHYVAKNILYVDSTTVMKAIVEHNIEYQSKNISTEEHTIKVELKKHGIKENQYIMNDKSVLSNNHELDFYFEKHKFAVEVNGLYWHSERVRPDRNYHQNKFDISNTRGVKLIQFWDFEINNKIDIVMSMILNNIGKTYNKIYAKNTIVKHVNPSDACEFINNNHLQNIVPSHLPVAYGLYHDDILVSIMTFKIDNGKHILNRFCNKIYHNVVGAFSKLLSYFIKNNTFDVIVSYSDDRYSNGNVYDKNGFVMTDRGDISYYYTKNHLELFHKSKFRKDKQKEMFENYDPNLTELQNMSNNGWYRVNGCRIRRWEYKL